MLRIAVERKALVRRRCLVCDWEDDLVEPVGTDEIGPPCRECRAPTERIAILQNLAGEDVAKNPSAVALGRLGGLKGGKARGCCAGCPPPARDRAASSVGAVETSAAPYLTSILRVRFRSDRWGVMNC